jgi:hypothetical protein
MPRVLTISLRIAMTAAVLYLAWTFLARYLAEQRWRQRVSAAPTSREADFARVYNSPNLQILQFYARDGVVLEGQPTVICYGVLNARAIHLDPPIEQLTPSLNRCIDAAPEHDTRYTLTAQGERGDSLSSSFEIQVKPNPADTPRITYFRAGKPRFEDGHYLFRVEWGQENGQLISIDPPVFPALHGAPFGQFYVAPKETTTYTLVVTGKRGHKTTRSLIVEVPPR